VGLAVLMDCKQPCPRRGWRVSEVEQSSHFSWLSLAMSNGIQSLRRSGHYEMWNVRIS